MKIWKKILIGCGLVFFPLLLQAQDGKKSSRIGFEFGFNDFLGEVVAPDRVRPGENIKGGGFFTQSYDNQTLHVPYLGIKIEQYLFEKKIGFGTGLRFSQFSSAVHGGYVLFSQNSFLWHFREDGNYVDYLSIRNITQDNFYLGIPLEFSYLLRKRDSFFKPYLKIGAVFNQLLYTKNSVYFDNEIIDEHAYAVGKQVEKPNSFNYYFYPALGFKLGKNYNIWGNIEFQFNHFLFSKNVHPFIRPNFGIGIQFSLHIPIE